MINRNSIARALALGSLIAAPCIAHAEDAPFSHVGVAVTAGFSGLGADLGTNINDYLGLRASVASFSINHNGDYGTSVSWDAKLKLFQAGLLLDVYPFTGTFRLTAGMVKDGNKFTMDGKPAGSTFTFNGNSYPSAAIPSASASVDWNKTAPYLGLGWGSLSNSAGFHFTSDFGVLITGSPKASISVGCNAALLASSGSPYTCSTLSSDVAAEQAKLQNDVNKINVWPVIRFGIGYTF